MRRIAYSLAAACALAGCATTNTSYPRPVTNAVYEPPPPPVTNMYTSAPRAPVHSELFACGNWGSNLGEIGYRGETTRYTPYMETPAGPLLRYPAEQACLSSGFGWRGASASGRQHNGLDLANPNGGYIFAAADGRVVIADVRGGYGNFIEIDHGRGVYTRYAHLAEIDPNLREGMRITAGTPMGRMGMTGNATGVHLHYEVMVDGLLVDPLHYGMPQQPPPFVTTPVTQTYAEPLPLPPPAVTPTPVSADAPEEAPAPEGYPEPVRLRPPSEQ